MSNLFFQNSNFNDFSSQITTSISSNSNNRNFSNEKKKLLKQKRKRNKNDNHEYNDFFNPNYLEDYFDCYNNSDYYDYSQKSSSEYHKDNIDFEKLKQDLMPKKNL
jgi:hypothetical protein